MTEKRPAVPLAIAAVCLAAAFAVQIVAGWPLSPRLTGPALLALTVGASAGLAFLAGIDFAGAGSAAARAVAVLGLALSVGGAWVGAGSGLLVLACGFVIWLAGSSMAPARIVLAVGLAAALSLSALYGPF